MHSRKRSGRIHSSEFDPIVIDLKSCLSRPSPYIGSVDSWRIRRTRTLPRPFSVNGIRWVCVDYSLAEEINQMKKYWMFPDAEPKVEVVINVFSN